MGHPLGAGKPVIYYADSEKGRGSGRGGFVGFLKGAIGKIRQESPLSKKPKTRVFCVCKKWGLGPGKKKKKCSIVLRGAGSTNTNHPCQGDRRFSAGKGIRTLISA